MKLTAKVTETISGGRIKLEVAQAEFMYAELKLPNADNYALDDEVVVLVLRQDDASELFLELQTWEDDPDTVFPQVGKLLDQLRPDPPPPFMESPPENVLGLGPPIAGRVLSAADAERLIMEQDEALDTAETQEFVRETTQ